MSAPMLAAPSVRPLLSHAELARTVETLVAQTRFEMLNAMPDGDYSAKMLRSSWDADMEMLNRGLDVRAIFPATCARRPDIMEYLGQLSARGVRVRVRSSVANRMLISDRRQAVIPDSTATDGRTVLLVKGPVLVRALHAEFNELWRSSMPVGFSAGGLDVEMIKNTVAALAEGSTDEAVARKYGWSVRTYRRRIAAVLDLLGVSTRFEAGVAAREQGWI
ncbi:hypothetical protein [Nakamurella aerolata]|uniref:HTH luxR-type domain-containing protein n=1 Tax=Nakamurella aerolata TaxID=1656892 RepID=A0A849A8E1_9ACTN|nr:hypothetical protein [Nakamurella aerolata]NNG35886.1 hypothetical protein [Nakamurella aerolata]